jgi:hypothetical protein
MLLANVVTSNGYLVNDAWHWGTTNYGVKDCVASNAPTQRRCGGGISYGATTEPEKSQTTNPALAGSVARTNSLTRIGSYIMAKSPDATCAAYQQTGDSIRGKDGSPAGNVILNPFMKKEYNIKPYLKKNANEMYRSFGSGNGDSYFLVGFNPGDKHSYNWHKAGQDKKVYYWSDWGLKGSVWNGDEPWGTTGRDFGKFEINPVYRGVAVANGPDHFPGGGNIMANGESLSAWSGNICNCDATTKYKDPSPGSTWSLVDTGSDLSIWSGETIKNEKHWAHQVFFKYGDYSANQEMHPYVNTCGYGNIISCVEGSIWVNTVKTNECYQGKCTTPKTDANGNNIGQLEISTNIDGAEFRRTPSKNSGTKADIRACSDGNRDCTSGNRLWTQTQNTDAWINIDDMFAPSWKTRTIGSKQTIATYFNYWSLIKGGTHDDMWGVNLWAKNEN